MDDELHPLVGAVVGLIAFTCGAFSLWCTVVAFAGGTLPLLGWNMKGSVADGVLWLFIATPILSTLGYWAAVIITMPLGVIFRERR